MPKSSHGRSRDGTRLRRRDLSSTDIVERNGLQISAVPLTVLEAAVRTRGGAKLMDSALQRHVELPTLWTAHLRNKGRHGSPAARRLLQAADGGAQSEAERLFQRLLTNAGIGGWMANRRVAGYEVDFVFRDAKLAIEIDGFAFHSDGNDFQRRPRQAERDRLGRLAGAAIHVARPDRDIPTASLQRCGARFVRADAR